MPRFAASAAVETIEEAQALVGDVPRCVPERPEPVPRVVVRDRDEERAGRRGQVVHAERFRRAGRRRPG